MDVDRTTVLLSILPIYADRITAGTKTIEFRRKPLPDDVTTALIWRTGKGGGIVGRFTVGTQRGADPRSWIDAYGRAAGVGLWDLITYADGARVWGIPLRDVASVSGAPLDPKLLHPALHRPPQSWRYAPKGWETKVEVPW